MLPVLGGNALYYVLLHMPPNPVELLPAPRVVERERKIKK
jgi:hypothetical protein